MFNLNKLIKNNEKRKFFGGSLVTEVKMQVIIWQKLSLSKCLLSKIKIIDKLTNKNKLLSIGSVMHFAKDNDSIWGTGINGKINESHLKFKNLDVRAVRGPRTREFLMGRGIMVPEIYGDPGLLLPMFFSKECL